MTITNIDHVVNFYQVQADDDPALCFGEETPEDASALVGALLRKGARTVTVSMTLDGLPKW